MKNLSLLAVLGAVVVLSLAGCSTTQSSCGCIPGNCCSWDFYKPCDLIEGRVDGQCPRVCGEPRCCQGVVATRCYDLPVQQPKAVVVEEVVEEAAPAAPAGE